MTEAGLLFIAMFAAAGVVALAVGFYRADKYSEELSQLMDELYRRNTGGGKR